MSADQNKILWTAPPHTIAKIDILQAYLVRYFQILGTSRRRQKILYVDGFSGPNRYTNKEFGSPGAAVSAAIVALEGAGSTWIAGDIHFAFVEDDPETYKLLLQNLPVSQSPRIHIHSFNSEFVKALPEIRKLVPEPFFSDHPLFVFIDPFGVKGAPFQTVASILAPPCSEILLNLDADGLYRIFKANYDSILTEVFGDESWKSELNNHQPPDVQYRSILKLYKNRLRTVDDVKYLFEVEMQGKSGKLNYFLVFASKHPLGLVKMKEAMSGIAQNGTYTFSDANVDQMALFGMNEPLDFSLVLLAHFEGQTVSYNGVTDEITTYALNHTPFFDAKRMLIILEAQKLITVTDEATGRRHGTFNDKVRTIHFHGKEQYELF